MFKPDALAAIASEINTGWGHTGYTIWAVHCGPEFGSAIAEVHHSDGSEFYVGADKYGNTRHGDTEAQVYVALGALTSSLATTEA